MQEKSFDQLIQELTSKKQQLDALRPLPDEVHTNLHNWFRVELTYSSNAIEGNTLTSSETALVLQKGLTIGGKTVKDHLEAINHAFAFDYIVDLAKSSKADINVRDVLDVHRLILRTIDDKNAGRFRTVLVRIAGSDIELPDPVKVPELMDTFIMWLHKVQDHPIVVAADAHLKFVRIHPFVDGNGRTARLLMNMLLLQEGYPPALIMPEDRNAYIKSLEAVSKDGDTQPYYVVIGRAVERSLDMYLKHAKGSI